MKKMLVLVAVLAIAMPAMAGVTLTKGTPSGGQVTVGYNYDGSGSRPRAFGLVLQSTGGTITAITPQFKGNGAGYGIFPGTFTVIPDVNNPNWNTAGYTPVEPNALPGGPSLLGTARVVVALGSLYAPTGVAGPNQPANSGTLFTITFSGGTNINVAPEVTNRGGVVGEDANTITVAAIDIPLAADCLQNKSAQIMADWVAYGKPASWCNAYQCDGDADGVTSGAPFNYRIYSGDLNLVVANWKKTMVGYPGNGLNPAADVDHKSSGAPFNYRVYSGDLNLVVANWKKLTNVFPGDCATRVQN